jgi:hypothetical protein
MRSIRKRLTYANVMSSIAVFLILGGASALAATHLAKNSVGTKQLKANAVTAVKIKGGAVSGPKLSAGAVGSTQLADGGVTAAKIANGAVSGAKVDLASLGTVPNAATTSMMKVSHGTIPVGGEATAFEYGPFKINVKCTVRNPTTIGPNAYISSSTEGSVFTSWEDGASDLGPSTPEAEREVSGATWTGSTGPFNYDSASDVTVSASAANGQSFTAGIALAAEKDSGTCWYWSNATILQ